MERGRIISDTLFVTTDLGDLKVVDACRAEHNSRELHSACCIIADGIADLLTVGRIDKHELEFASLELAAIQDLLAAEISVDVKGNGRGRKAVAEDNFSGRHIILGKLHLCGKHALGIVGYGCSYGINGFIVIVIGIAVILFGQLVDIDASLGKGNLAEIDQSGCGVAHCCGCGHRRTSGHSLQLKLEFTVLHCFTGEKFSACKGNLGIGRIIGVPEDNVLHILRSVIDHNGSSDSLIAVVGNRNSHSIDSAVVGEAADLIGADLGQLIHIGLTLVGITEFNRPKGEGTVCSVPDSSIFRHRSAGRNRLKHKRKLIGIQHAVTVDFLLTGNGNIVRRRGDIFIGEGGDGHPLCQTGDYGLGRNRSVKVILNSNLHLIDRLGILDVVDGCAAVYLGKVIGIGLACVSCGIVQGDGGFSGSVSKGRFYKLVNIRACRGICIIQGKLIAIEGVACQCLLDIHCCGGCAGGRIHVIEACRDQPAAADSGVQHILYRDDLQIAVHIAVGNNHSKSAVSSIVGNTALGALDLGDSVVISACCRIVLTCEGKQMCLRGVIVVDGRCCDNRTRRTGQVHPFQIKGIAFAGQPILTAACNFLGNLDTDILAVGTRRRIGIDDQCLVVGRGVHNTGKLAFLGVKGKAIGNILFGYGVLCLLRQASDNKGFALRKCNSILAVLHGDVARSGSEGSADGFAGNICKRNFCGKLNTVVYIHSASGGIHNLLGNDKVAFAHSSVHEIDIINQILRNSTCCRCTCGNAVNVYGLNLIVAVIGYLFNSVGRSCGKSREPEGLILLHLKLVNTVCKGHGSGIAAGRLIKLCDPGIIAASYGCGHTELKAVGGAGFKDINSLGNLDAGCGGNSKKAVVTKVHIHINHVILLGNIGVEYHLSRIGAVYGLLLIIHLKLTGRCSLGNHPGTELAGEGFISAAPLCRGNGGSGHFLIEEHGPCFTLLKDISAVVVFAVFIQCFILTDQNIAIAALLENSRVKGEVESLVLLIGRKRRHCRDVIIVGACGNIKVVIPENTGMAVIRNILSICDAGNVELIQVGTQTRFVNQTNGSHSICIINVNADIGSRVHIGARQFYQIGYHRNERCRNLPDDCLLAGFHVRVNLNGHIHHIAVLDTAGGFAQEAIRTVDINCICRNRLGSVLIVEACVGPVSLCVPGNIVGPVIRTVILQLAIRISLGNQRLGFGSVRNAETGFNRTDKLIAQRSGIFNSAKAAGRGISKLGGHHMAVIKGVTEKDALNILDLHIGAKGISKFYVSGKVRAAALQMGGIVTGLENDFFYNIFKSFRQPITGSREVPVNIMLICNIGILADGYLRTATAASFDRNTHRAGSERTVGFPQLICFRGAVRIQNALGNGKIAHFKAQSIE